MKKWLPLWIFPVGLALALLTVWVRLSVVRNTYSVNQTDRVIGNLVQERELLNLKVTELRSPGRLERLAREKFGLRRPASSQIVHLQ